MKEKIVELIKHLAAFEKLRSFKTVKAQMFGEQDEKEKAKDKKEGTPVLEGISFRYKTVQFHLIDDTFEEIKKNPDVFGDVEIYSERFSLPGWGKEEFGLKRNEYQFEIIALVKSRTDKEQYLNELEKVMNAISDKHGVDIEVIPTEKYYNVNYIIFHTAKEGIFSKD